MNYSAIGKEKVVTDSLVPNQQLRITIEENGPYHVTGGVPLKHRTPAKSVHGEPLAWDEVGQEPESARPRARYNLCRCGQSENKPFCDGSHARLGFAGALTADRAPSASRRETYVGDGIVITDDHSLCAGGGFCGTRLRKAWEMLDHSSDPEVRARIADMVKNCPSGRLQYSTTEGGESIEPQFEPSIGVLPNGPLWVRGGIAVEADDGATYEVRNRVTLCRCGHSKNKPFCDETHEAIGFRAP
jgi:CDGSH-type Zn-finger protein